MSVEIFTVYTEAKIASIRGYCTKLVLLAFALVWLLGLGALVVRGQAQDDDPLHVIGIPQLSGQMPVPNGFVNVANGDLHLEFPIVSLSQRGRSPFKIALAYDSNLWYQNWCCFAYLGNFFNNFNPNVRYPGPAGWRLFASTDSQVTYSLTDNGS